VTRKFFDKLYFEKSMPALRSCKVPCCASARVREEAEGALLSVGVLTREKGTKTCHANTRY